MARSPLLLIDDNLDNLGLLERTLEWGGFVNVRSCQSAKEGLAVLSTFDPHLIILDLMMPGMNGYEFLETVFRDASPGTYLPVLVFTADLTPEAKIKCLALGAADFLTKPGDAIEIQLRVRNFLRTRHLHADLQNQNEILEAKVRKRTELLEVARREAVQILARAGEYKDDDTGCHSQRVGQMSAAIANIIGLDHEFVESIRLVAPLHDIGKIAVPDTILHKEGKLTAEEYEIIKQHVPIGAKLLSDQSSPLLVMAREIALYHHERWDGRGYITGLAGEAIPISARIVTAADAFDAMTNDRPYRKAMSEEMALAELEAMSGTQFDPHIVRALSTVVTHQSEVFMQAA